MSDRLALPKKLEDDLSKMSRYKPTPFNIDDVLTTSVENALFDDVFGSVVKKGERKGESKSSDFTALLASKLADTEKENKALRNRLAMSNMKITRLEESLQEMKDVAKTQGHNNSSTDSFEAMHQIRHDNSRLQRQLMEMEQFLADYGLNWVGYSEGEQQEEAEAEAGQRDDAEEREEEMHNFDLFKKRVDELNALIAEEPAKVVTTSGGGGNVKARFAHASGKCESKSRARAELRLFIVSCNSCHGHIYPAPQRPCRASSWRCTETVL